MAYLTRFSPLFFWLCLALFVLLHNDHPIIFQLFNSFLSDQCNDVESGQGSGQLKGLGKFGPLSPNYKKPILDRLFKIGLKFHYDRSCQKETYVRHWRLSWAIFSVYLYNKNMLLSMVIEN